MTQKAKMFFSPKEMRFLKKIPFRFWLALAVVIGVAYYMANNQDGFTGSNQIIVAILIASLVVDLYKVFRK